MTIAMLMLLLAQCTLGAEGPSQFAYRSDGGFDLGLRVHFPRISSKSARPAIVLFHGGSWARGTPSQLDWLACGLAERGWVVVSAEYRLLDKGAKTIADCAADARAAVAAVHSYAAKWNVDRERIAVGGASAGAQLALVAARAANCPSSAVICLNPVLSAENPRFHSFFVGHEAELDPITFVNRGLPPILLLHGCEDQVVPFTEAREFARLAEARGVKISLHVFPGEGHGFFNPPRAGTALHAQLIELISRFPE